VTTVAEQVKRKKPCGFLNVFIGVELSEQWNKFCKERNSKKYLTKDALIKYMKRELLKSKIS
jgi:hypothetical protein